MIAAVTVLATASSGMAQQWSNEATITYTINQWMGGGREFNSKANWHLGLLVAVAPDPNLPVHVGPVRVIVDSIPTDTYLIPSSIPRLTSNFSSPRVDVVAIGSPTGLEMDGARYTADSYMTVGQQPTNGYGTGDVIPSVLTLRNGAYVDSPSLIVGDDSMGELHVYGNCGAEHLLLARYPGSWACMVIQLGATIDRFASIQMSYTTRIKNFGSVRIRPEIRIHGTDLEWTNEPGSTLRIGGTLGVTGTLTNHSLITFAGLPEATAETLTLVDNVTLVGGGEVVMVEENDSRIDGVALINVDNVIRGVGNIACPLINQHIVRVEGGTLYFPTSYEIDNTGGTILVAPGSTLRGGSVINGGILGTLPDSRVEYFRLRDVTIPGTLVTTQLSGLTLEGTITNTGTITFAGDPDLGVEAFDVLGEVSLVGGGELVMMEDHDSRVGTGNPDEHLINVDNVIRGTGRWVAKLTNQHIIRVENGPMTMPGNGCDNTNGNIIVDPSGTLTGSSVEGGTVWTEADSRVATTLRNVTIPGTLTVSAAAGRVYLEESLINTGTVTFEGSAANDQENLFVEGTVTLSGDGELVLIEEINSMVGSSNPGDVLINVDNVIRGSGYFQCDLINQHLVRAENGKMTFGKFTESLTGLIEIASTGALATGLQDVRIATLNIEPGGMVNPERRIEIRTLNGDLDQLTGTYAPGLGAEVSTLSGNYTLQRFADLEIEIGGSSPGEFDQLSVDGDVSLAGSLDIVALNGFTAQPGQRFGIMSINGTLTGIFVSLPEGALVTNLGEDIFITYVGGDGNDIELYTNP